LYCSIIKPSIDKITAIVLLMIASPVFLIVILALAFVNHGKVWYRQTRPGRQGKPFTIFKFKTMTDEQDVNAVLLADEKRLTRIGKMVRNLSLDELPQLINVLQGDMSIVGPRPLLMEYLPLYNNEQQKRMKVKPGITGWAQVNGRNAISWKSKFEYDAWYVDHCSFYLDIKIILLTIVKVAKAEGISSTGSITMEKFTGNG
jgi:undecaprenyl phosphate N,N'-diacetylbacillosamine 1-phosphate transferase